MTTAGGEVVLDPLADGSLDLYHWFELRTADGDRFVFRDRRHQCRGVAVGNTSLCDYTYTWIGLASRRSGERTPTGRHHSLRDR